MKDKNVVKRIAIILFPNSEGFNEAFIDNVRVEGSYHYLILLLFIIEIKFDLT